MSKDPHDHPDLMDRDAVRTMIVHLLVPDLNPRVKEVRSQPDLLIPRAMPSGTVFLARDDEFPGWVFQGILSGDANHKEYAGNRLASGYEKSRCPALAREVESSMAELKDLKILIFEQCWVGQLGVHERQQGMAYFLRAGQSDALHKWLQQTV